MKTAAVALLLLFCNTALSQNDELYIRGILQRQAEAWNRGDLEGFMETYWKSDSLVFIGSNGVKYGWEETLRNYRKGYPDSIAMGHLSFELLQVQRLSDDYYFVIGKWMLARRAGDLSGHFNLLVRKIGGRWLIVADHSS